jgi:UDP-N-acetylmuramoyl-tripeptide--D-alanyl-D-alanine ligase
VGKYFNVPGNKIKVALESYSPGNSRSQMVEQGTNKIILDAYNANPTSTKAAIENLAGIRADRKVLMLGGMMELGEESLEEHQAIIDLIKQHKWEQVVLVGGDYSKLTHPFTYFNTSAEARDWYKNSQLENTYFLIKGSRSIQMEKILQD